MKTKKQPFDYDHHDLAGHASVDFNARENFSTFASQLTEYNADRFTPVALRIFAQKGTPIVTLYALDKTKKAEKGRLPVKKFKLRLSLIELLGLIKRFDFTVSDGNYDLSKIIVTNK